MSSRTLPLLCTAMMLAPVLIWYRQAGDPGIYFSPAAPPGQLLYVLSKLAGMYALLLATLQLLLGFMKGPGLTTVSTLRRRHALIGAGVVLLVLAHAALFFSAVSLRQGYPAWGLLAPDFRDFYHSHLSFGLLALVLLLGVALSGIMRRGGRSRTARLLHRVLSSGLRSKYTNHPAEDAAHSGSGTYRTTERKSTYKRNRISRHSRPRWVFPVKRHRATQPSSMVT